MAIRPINGEAFVAFIDISGFKELMKREDDALRALRIFYQAGYDTINENHNVQGIFVSDCGILFSDVTGPVQDRLCSILAAVKNINEIMLSHSFMLTTSIAFGDFRYDSRVEIQGIAKNSVYGNAYVSAFLDNEVGKPKIQPGQCRIIARGVPEEILSDRRREDERTDEILFVRKRPKNNKHYFYYWNVESTQAIERFENEYNDSYTLKYNGMLLALQNSRRNR